MKRCRHHVVAAVAVAAAGLANAAGPDPEPGFGGQLSLGAVSAKARTNMVASPGLGIRLGDASLDGLDRQPRAHDAVLPLLSLSLQYAFASTGTRLFVDSGNGDPLQFDGVVQVGVRQSIGSAGLMSLAYLYGPPVDVWADPYAAGVQRKQTSRQSQGARLEWGGILGSPVQVHYVFRRITVDDEESGALAGLSSTERALLQRAGDVHQGELSYACALGATQQLTPALRYTREELRGAAMSAHTYELALRYAFAAGPFLTQVEASIGRSEHDERNPVFSKTQADLRYAVAVTAVYRTPFGWAPFNQRRWSLFATVGYAAADSNIEFYSASVLASGAGVSLEF